MSQSQCHWVLTQKSHEEFWIIAEGNLNCNKSIHYLTYIYWWKKEPHQNPGVVAHIWSPSMWHAEAEYDCDSKAGMYFRWVLGQPERHSKTLSVGGGYLWVGGVNIREWLSHQYLKLNLSSNPVPITGSYVTFLEKSFSEASPTMKWGPSINKFCWAVWLNL